MTTLLSTEPGAPTTASGPGEPSAPPPERRFRVPGLDGVRALAVTVVVVFHLAPSGVLPGGYLGVDVFFVVSGFLITTLLLRERAGSGGTRLGAFWIRRARRLLPALFLLLLVCSAVAAMIGGDVLVGLGVQILAALTFSSNWAFIATGSAYFDAATPELFRNLWSLAVEEQFYLVWPILLVVLLVRIPRWARLSLVGVVAVGSAVLMALVWSPADATRAYYGTDTHAFGLAAGAFLALLVGDGTVRRAGRAARGWAAGAGFVALGGLLALAAVLPEDSAEAFRGGLALVAVLTVVLLASLLVPGSPVARVLDLAPLRWIGVRSYGIYLWHWPVWVLLAAVIPWPRDGAGGWALGGIALGVTVAAAALSSAFVETPLRRDGFRATFRRVRDVAPRSRRALAAAAAMVTSATLVVVALFGVIRDPGRGEVEALVQAGRDAIATAPPGTATPSPDPTTPPPQPAAGSQITAIGDSVMLAAAPTLQQEFPGIAIDASVSRSMYAAPAIVQAQISAGTLRQVVVVALGTNGPVDRETLERLRRMIGPDRELVLVNAQAPRGWIPGVNAELSSFAQYYRSVELANWYAAIQPKLGLLAGDQVHFGPGGAAVFAGTIRDALQRLAELPPLRDDSDDLSLPAPF